MSNFEQKARELITELAYNSATDDLTHDWDGDIEQTLKQLTQLHHDEVLRVIEESKPPYNKVDSPSRPIEKRNEMRARNKAINEYEANLRAIITNEGED